MSCCKFEIYLVGGNTKFTAWQLPQSKFKMYMTEVKKQEINKSINKIIHVNTCKSKVSFAVIIRKKTL